MAIPESPPTKKEQFNDDEELKDITKSIQKEDPNDDWTFQRIGAWLEFRTHSDRILIYKLEDIIENNE